MVQCNQYIPKHQLLEADNVKSDLFVIHSSQPVIKKNQALRNVLCESLQIWIVILNEYSFIRREF